MKGKVEDNSHLRESVVEVVAALAARLQVRPRRLDGRDRGVVRLVAKHVRSRVDQAKTAEINTRISISKPIKNFEITRKSATYKVELRVKMYRKMPAT